MNVELWEKLERFELDHPGAGFSFSKRLARENGWSVEFTHRVVEEYRRFLYLCCEAGHPVTPSDEVDQAWHLHLCYTRSYWDDLCRDTLGQSIHHGPTKGGTEENEKFHDWYDKTRESYRRHFGESPPEEIWPAPEVRFAPRRFRRVDVGRQLLLSKSSVRIAALAVFSAAVLAGCENFNEEEYFVVAMVIIVAVVCIAISLYNRNGGGGKGGSGCGGGGGIGGCGKNDGCGGDGCGGGGCGGGCGS